VLVGKGRIYLIDNATPVTSPGYFAAS